ncbi:MAG: type II restriction endonuclease [Spirochaetia bacterium]|nr:type II restriction endonuclease [Spirochaetia bacterium]
MSEPVFLHPIASCAASQGFFFKYISANEVGATGSHQAGFYMPRDSWRLFFSEPGVKETNQHSWIKIKWNMGLETESRFVWYGKGTRSEYRLTNGFQFLNDNNAGDVLILSKRSLEHFEGFILSADLEIEDFFAAFGLTPEDSGAVQSPHHVDEATLEPRLATWIKTFAGEFPPSDLISAQARDEVKPKLVHGSDPARLERGIDLDSLLLRWVESELRLFRFIENHRYKDSLSFESVDDFVQKALSILNRRKSRAGYSLENHLSEIFKWRGLRFSAQEITEENKRPDFLFPGSAQYQDPSFPAAHLRMLAVKTTCKDRWRQILSEADRIERKHLFTLQQGISSNQMEEMERRGVILVVPEKYKASFPPTYQSRILSLREFLNEVAGLPIPAGTAESSEYRLF